MYYSSLSNQPKWVNMKDKKYDSFCCKEGTILES